MCVQPTMYLGDYCSAGKKCYVRSRLRLVEDVVARIYSTADLPIFDTTKCLNDQDTLLNSSNKN